MINIEKATLMPPMIIMKTKKVLVDWNIAFLAPPLKAVPLSFSRPSYMSTIELASVFTESTPVSMADLMVANYGYTEVIADFIPDNMAPTTVIYPNAT